MAGCADGQLRTVGTRTHQSDSSPPWHDVPRPLHITKRSALGRGNRVSRNALGGSPESDTSDATMDSPPEPPGGHRPLTLPKRRGDRGAWAVYHPVGCTRDKDRDRESADDRATAPLADPAALKPRRSASCTTSSRQLKGRLPYRSPPSNGPSLLRSGPRPVLDGRADHGSTQGRMMSPILPGTPEGVWEHNSPPRSLKSTFRLPPSYESDDDARTLHTPVRAEHKSPPGPRSSPYFPDTAVLVPHIVVTPEHGTVDEGTVTVWVAVQLSAQVCRALAPEQGYGTATGPRPSPDALRYGFLYDVSTELLPAGKSIIIEVLDDKACAKILHPGSRLLFVAHIRLEPAARRRPRTHVRQKSDDLIEDLEHELGGTVTEYLQVRVAYRHSGFPQIHKQTAGTISTPGPDGIASVQTIIQTTATAAIKRHNSASPWSPPPSLPRPNPLFDVIAPHWGVDNAHAVMQRVMRSRSVRPNAGHHFGEPPVLGFISSLATSRGQDGQGRPQFQRSPRTNQEIPRPASSPPTRAAAAPPIPRRQASLRRVAGPSQHDSDEYNTSLERDDLHPESSWPTQQQQQEFGGEEVEDLATVRRKSHRTARARRAVSFFQEASSSSPCGPPSSPSPPFSSTAARKSPTSVIGGSTSSRSGARAETEKQQQQRGLGLRGKWMDAAPAALTPVVVDVKMIDGEETQVKRSDGKGSSSSIGSVKTRKGKEKERGWGWTGWWQ